MNKKEKGFTLTEVLITLAIIGIVAAMTIPTLIADYQKKAWNTASTVFERKLEEALKIMNAQSSLAGYTTTETFVDELSKHIKINKICRNDNLAECFEDNILGATSALDVATGKIEAGENTDMDISTVLIASAWELIKNSFKKGNWTKTKHQLNLKWSLEDYFNSNQKKEILMNEIEKNMFRYMKEQDWDFKNDEEYYFGVGQMASFLIGKSRSAKKPMSFINIYLSAGNDQVIKEQLRTLFQKYSYDISYTDWRVKSLFSHLMLYRPNGKVNKEMIIAGATASNVIYKKEEED